MKVFLFDCIEMAVRFAYKQEILIFTVQLCETADQVNHVTGRSCWKRQTLVECVNPDLHKEGAREQRYLLRRLVNHYTTLCTNHVAANPVSTGHTVTQGEPHPARIN